MSNQINFSLSSIMSTILSGDGLANEGSALFIRGLRRSEMTLHRKLLFMFSFFLCCNEGGTLSSTLAQSRTDNIDGKENEVASEQTPTVRVLTKLGVYEVKTLREPISIDLGHINAGSKQSYTLRLENKLGMDLFPMSVSRSCNCIIANVPSDTWRDNDTIEFDILITVGPSGGHLFRQKLTLLDRNNAVAPLVLDFCGKTIEPLTINSSVFVVEELGKKVETELVVKCVAPDDDLSNSNVECSVTGVNLTINSRSKNSIRFTALLDSAAAFRGRPSIKGAIHVRNFLRDGQAVDCTINVEVKFSKIVVALPDKISFQENDGRFVGKILLYGNFSTAGPTPVGATDHSHFAHGNEILIRASWKKESNHDDLEVSSTLIKPNILSVTVFSEKPTSTANRYLHFVVGANGAGVSVPAEFAELERDTGNLTKSK